MLTFILFKVKISFTLLIGKEGTSCLAHREWRTLQSCKHFSYHLSKLLLFNQCIEIEYQIRIQTLLNPQHIQFSLTSIPNAFLFLFIRQWDFLMQILIVRHCKYTTSPHTRLYHVSKYYIGVPLVCGNWHLMIKKCF